MDHTEDLVTLYRVEHEQTGGGPYRDPTNGYLGSRTTRKMARRDTADRHPTWRSNTPDFECEVLDLEGELARARMRLLQRIDDAGNTHGRFAFPSLLAVREWFHEDERKSLKDEGFTLREYRVPREAAAMSHRQAIYVHEAARFAGSRDLLTLRGEVTA